VMLFDSSPGARAHGKLLTSSTRATVARLRACRTVASSVREVSAPIGRAPRILQQRYATPRSKGNWRQHGPRQSCPR
jgi:hypothetical protein